MDGGAMRRAGVALLVGLVACSLAIRWGPRGAEARASPCCRAAGQDPAKDVGGGCSTQLAGGGINSVRAFPKSAVCKWQFTYLCTGDDPTSSCRVCYRAEVDYFSAKARQWYVAPGGLQAPQASTGQCGYKTTEKITSTYFYPTPRGPIKKGTQMRFVVEYAVLDPGLSKACFGQDFQEVGRRGFTVPD